MFDEVLKILQDGSWQEFAEIINKRCIDHVVVRDLVLQTPRYEIANPSPNSFDLLLERAKWGYRISWTLFLGMISLVRTVPPSEFLQSCDFLVDFYS